MAYLDVELNFRYNYRFKSSPRAQNGGHFWKFRNIWDRFILTADMERPSEINIKKVLVMLMTSQITSQRDVKFGFIQETDTDSAYMSKSQYMQSYWFSNQSNINIIYNVSVITITNKMSIMQILANFGKYTQSPIALSFVCLSVCLSVMLTIQLALLEQSTPNSAHICVLDLATCV